MLFEVIIDGILCQKCIAFNIFNLMNRLNVFLKLITMTRLELASVTVLTLYDSSQHTRSMQFTFVG